MLQVTHPELRGCKRQPGSGGSLQSKEVQANPDWVTLDWNRTPSLSPAFLLHCHLPHSIHLEGGWVSLCLWAFVKGDLQTLPSGDRRQPGQTHGPSSECLPRRGGSEDKGGSGELCCPPRLGSRNSPAERGKNRQETRIYYYQAITRTPTSVFQILSSLCNHFPLERKE